MKIHLIKSLGVLKPVDESDLEVFNNLKTGDIYSCEIKKPRNIKFHRMFFAMINLCFQNQDVFGNVEYFRKEMCNTIGKKSEDALGTFCNGGLV